MSNAGSSQATPQETSQTSIPPTDVVSQFLDLVRRGGQTDQATALLTTKAQLELKRIGRSVQPIGSPDAQFKVTRSELVPNESPGEIAVALVHCLWLEPGDSGTAEPTEVVWAVQEESGSWKISGLAMQVAPDQDPIVINFENGKQMDAILAESESPADPTSNESSAQAAANDQILSR